MHKKDKGFLDDLLYKTYWKDVGRNEYNSSAYDDNDNVMILIITITKNGMTVITAERDRFNIN